ncbi:hypothetical protein AVEN_162043-1 [Araneus ventricosus]|uniref:Uncharacterized protein n=1 Tax=Araneus ventricosus TaxID=182803 RepID=A0A4Y2TJB1_ARAVE|nr:hypothetical protein AVEN_182356-1 [Araneus ventricosus]GBN99536.1 hypothetical protein AVEN_136516-1 [Araneus ventricosus]GBN99537.1 hypothetical protein AVEN_162043-1 [Araneus ventricosus]
METRHIFSKKERKSSSKHDTEWDHQLPSRTSFEVIIKSSEVQRETKVIRNHQSPLMSSNKVNTEQNGQRNEADSENDKTAGTQRSNQDSKTASLLGLSSESSTEKLKTSGRSSNFSEPGSSVEKERTAKNSDVSQLPEHSQNSHSCYVNEAAMGESGLFPNKLLDPKSNFYNKINLNLSSSKDHSPRKKSKVFSPLKIHRDIPNDSQKNALDGGDYVCSIRNRRQK